MVDINTLGFGLNENPSIKQAANIMIANSNGQITDSASTVAIWVSQQEATGNYFYVRDVYDWIINYLTYKGIISPGTGATSSSPGSPPINTTQIAQQIAAQYVPLPTISATDLTTSEPTPGMIQAVADFLSPIPSVSAATTGSSSISELSKAQTLGGVSSMATTTKSTDIVGILNAGSSILTAAAPIISALAPEAGIAAGVGGSILSGVTAKKSTKTTGIKQYRHMNVGNMKALRRAARRVERFDKTARKVVHIHERIKPSFIHKRK